jgi:OmpA family
VDPVPTTVELATLPRVEPPVDPDADHDGRLGPADRCPAQAETYEGTDDDDGCPDAPSLVRLSDAGDRIELLAKVVWKNAGSGILAEPEPVVLRDLAALMHALPGVEIEIQAHEAPHEDLYGSKPTDRQARAVAGWLVAHGIERQRILAVGYGESRPLASNRTAEGRAANARVEVWVRKAAGEGQ